MQSPSGLSGGLQQLSPMCQVPGGKTQNMGVIMPSINNVSNQPQVSKISVLVHPGPLNCKTQIHGQVSPVGVSAITGNI